MLRFTSAVFFFLLFALFSTYNAFAVLEGGQIDYSFKPARVFPPLGDTTRDLAVQPDGRVLTVGRFSADTQNTQIYKLYRFFPNGQIDSSLNPTYPVSDIRISAFALQPDGKIVYAYISRFPTNYLKVEISRIEANGNTDSSFSFTFPLEGVANRISVQPNGKILVSGNLLTKDEPPVALSVIRLNADGSFDQNFNSVTRQTNASVQKVLMNANGSFSVLENFSAAAPKIRSFDTNGNSTGEITVNFPADIYAIDDFLVQPDGKIVIAGRRGAFPQLTNFTGRLMPNGNPDNQFQTNGAAGALALDNSGKIIINGKIRLNSNGEVDNTFQNPFGAGTIYLQANGSAYLRGAIDIGGKAFGVVRIYTAYTAARQRATDFDGDGKADIAVFRPSNGAWYWLNSSNNSFSAVNFGQNGDIPAVGDFDGDTRADVSVFRPSNGVWYRLNSSNGAFAAIQFGMNGDKPITSDFDGDGKTDIAVFRPSNGFWFRLNSTNGAFIPQAFGLNGDISAAGDFDGDGKADLSVWRPSNSVWYRLESIDSSFKFEQFSYFDGDYAAPADYDGDNRLDLTIWKDITGGWYGLRSSIGNGVFFQFGSSGDIPVPADYDGDNKEDYAVFRPSTGTWWIISSADTSVRAIRFGSQGDIPIPSTLAAKQ